jgi:15-cis-phytoene desaturase
MSQQSNEVIVIGGGLAGLSCAVALADAGLRVTVLEGTRELGGRARSWVHQPSGDVVDIGPHLVHSEYANFLQFLQRLGTRGNIAWQPEKLITLATPHGPADLRHRRLTPPLSLLPDMARASRLGLRAMSSNNGVTKRALQFDERQIAPFDAMTGMQLLQRCGTAPAMVDWFWRFATMAVLNAPLERCSAASLLRVHSQLIGHRNLHFGFAAVGLNELYVQGSTRIIEAMGGQVLTDARVESIQRIAGGQHVLRTAQGERFAAAHIVLALPPANLRLLCPMLVADTVLEPSPYRSVYVWFDRKVTDERFWALLWSPTRLNYDFYDLSNIRPGLAQRPSVIASNVIYSHRAAHLSADKLVQETVREIAEFVPGARDARVLHADVHDIPMAVPCPVPGFESARPPAMTRMRGVYLAGDWTRTGLPCSMESAVRSGYLAAEAVLWEERQPRSIAREVRGNDGLAGWMQRRSRRRIRRRAAS